ncbi:MAG TPA: peptidylprolyl isomerase [Thermomicrobiaceae bacterium]|nr:peptidylprolyl isomerase [Thermomicrobiaceae bacterium]
MIDRVRRLFGRGGSGPTTRRRVSRREREEFQRRLVIIGITIATVLLVLILGIGAVYQYLYLPHQTLVTVNGTAIDRADYWMARKLTLINEVQQYSQYAQFSTGQQATQYQQLAQQAQTQLGTVEQDSVDPGTLSQLVDGQIALQKIGTLGLSVTNADVDQLLAQFFSPVQTASPTPTLGTDPTAAAWATATAQAEQTATPSASPVPSATPGTTPSATPSNASTVLGTPGAATPGATPAATPAGTPAPAATPNPQQAAATATATYQQFKTNVLDKAGMSLDDYRRLVARPEVAQQKIDYKLQSAVPTRADQIHAAHILVATQEAANAIEDQLKQGADFAQLAKDKSTDKTTAVNGGDLGWFPRGVMVKAFEDAAFSLQPGQVSQPVHTQFGWHIIKVSAKETNRPVDVSILTQLRNQAFTNWLDQQRAQSSIKWNVAPPTPTPTPAEFQPPAGAPPTPTPTPSPTPLPATPGASPAATPTP